MAHSAHAREVVMPDPDRLIRTIRRAAELSRAVPGRRGRVVHLDAAEVLVSGDLHGHLGNFQALLKRADLANHPGRHLVFQEVIHGPYRYPAGGDKSHQLVDLVAALTCQFPRQVHYLLGNHELAQATGRLIVKNETDFNGLFRDGVGCAYGSRAGNVYAAYLEWFAAVPVALRTANRVFLSHSLPAAKRLSDFSPARLELDPSDPPDLQLGGSVHSLVWGRDTDERHVAAFLQTVDADWLVSGHIATPEGFAVPNDRQLILDSLGPTAGYCLFATDRPVAHADLVAAVRFL